MASVQREVVQPRANLQALTRQQRSDWLNQLNYVGSRAQELRDVFISQISSWWDLVSGFSYVRLPLQPQLFLFLHYCMHACSERHTLHCSSAAPSIKYPFNYPLNLLNQLKMHLLVLAQIHEDGENPLASPNEWKANSSGQEAKDSWEGNTTTHPTHSAATSCLMGGQHETPPISFKPDALNASQSGQQASGGWESEETCAGHIPVGV